MYTVFRKLETGDLMHIASRVSLEEACELIARIKSLWSEGGEYVVQDAAGKQVLPFDRSDI